MHGTAEVAWEARAGVCQDMAHITLGCLRAATNGIAPGEGHVVVGHGREYPDVAPLRNIFAGGATSSMFVEVEITRLR